MHKYLKYFMCWVRKICFLCNEMIFTILKIAAIKPSNTVAPCPCGHTRLVENDKPKLSYD